MLCTLNLIVLLDPFPYLLYVYLCYLIRSIILNFYIVLYMNSWLVSYIKVYCRVVFPNCGFPPITSFLVYLFHFIHPPQFYLCNLLFFTLIFFLFFHLFSYQKCFLLPFSVSLWHTMKISDDDRTQSLPRPCSKVWRARSSSCLWPPSVQLPRGLHSYWSGQKPQPSFTWGWSMSLSLVLVVVHVQAWVRLRLWNNDCFLSPGINPVGASVDRLLPTKDRWGVLRDGLYQNILRLLGLTCCSLHLVKHHWHPWTAGHLRINVIMGRNRASSKQSEANNLGTVQDRSSALVCNNATFDDTLYLLVSYNVALE